MLASLQTNRCCDSSASLLSFLSPSSKKGSGREEERVVVCFFTELYVRPTVPLRTLRQTQQIHLEAEGGRGEDGGGRWWEAGRRLSRVRYACGQRSLIVRKEGHSPLGPVGCPLGVWRRRPPSPAGLKTKGSSERGRIITQNKREE